MRLFFTILLTLAYYTLSAQRLCVPKNPLLDYLIHSPKEIGTIRNTIHAGQLLHLGIDILDIEPQQLVRSKSGLYVLVEGTGRVYRYSESRESMYCFDRLDSTVFGGYNFQSVPFVYKDTLYSFGGYGFWHWNGQLRYFNTFQHGWLVKEINREVHGSARAFQYNPGSDFFYYIQHPYTDVVTGKSLTEAKAVELNLQTRNNRILGEITKEMRELMPMDVDNFHYMPINMPELGGIMVNYKLGRQFLLDFKKNEIYQLRNRVVMDALFQPGIDVHPVNIFHANDTLYYTLSNDTQFKLHSVPLSFQDFRKLPIRIYTPDPGIFMKTEVWFFLVVVIMVVAGLVRWGLKRERTQKGAEVISGSSGNAGDGIVFTQVEISLIR